MTIQLLLFCQKTIHYFDNFLVFPCNFKSLLMKISLSFKHSELFGIIFLVTFLNFPGKLKEKQPALQAEISVLMMLLQDFLPIVIGFSWYQHIFGDIDWFLLDYPYF